ncbi:MAG: ATP-dependent Clp protease proteolytic subunit [Candidatus Marinimicrobia bacterium]|nr:ATP-dependent Clp protease proteolytic subunit [Candidatus Neomarinimicrobiota bacterium]
MSGNNHIGKELIEKIEEKRKSKVIVYFTGDRHPFGSRIAEDAVRPLYDHLLNLEFNENDKRIDIFLYSRGGDVSVPWRIVSMIREFCDEFNVLIPYRAQSAATLLSMGADNIVMGKKAELGPIDPTLVKATIGETAVPPQEIAVEDVSSFLSFIKERANINDQDAVANILNSLINQIGPLTLGSVNRQHHHIRLVARKLLTSRQEKLDEEKISTIIETLTEKIYSHGHAIGRREAKDIGLPVEYPEEKLENLMWELYLKYEDFLKLREPIHPELILKDKYQCQIENMPIAIIESAKKLHIFKTNIELNKERNIPPNPQMNINLGLQLPAGVNIQEIPQQVQQILNQLLNQVSQMIPGIVQQEIERQSPVIGIKGRALGGKWIEEI